MIGKCHMIQEICLILTLHMQYQFTRASGSEYSVVIIPVSEDHIHMLSRNLVYTAITRGKVKVVMVGDKNSFQRAIANSAKDFRYTDLVRVIDTRF